MFLILLLNNDNCLLLIKIHVKFEIVGVTCVKYALAGDHQSDCYIIFCNENVKGVTKYKFYIFAYTYKINLNIL